MAPSRSPRDMRSCRKQAELKEPKKRLQFERVEFGPLGNYLIPLVIELQLHSFDYLYLTRSYPRRLRFNPDSPVFETISLLNFVPPKSLSRNPTTLRLIHHLSFASLGISV